MDFPSAYQALMTGNCDVTPLFDLVRPVPALA